MNRNENESVFLKEDYSMACPRCGGLMVGEWHYGPRESFYAIRCVLCGNVEDSVILRNRNSIPVPGEAA
jgi:late competence protein required for DNA uptake (superfamily II DNA/RNA helicase)